MGDFFLAFKVTGVGQGAPWAPAAYQVNLIPSNQNATVGYLRQLVLDPNTFYRAYCYDEREHIPIIS